MKYFKKYSKKNKNFNKMNVLKFQNPMIKST